MEGDGEASENVVRVKEELSDTWTSADEGYVFNSMGSCKAEKVEIFPLHELSAKHVNEAVARSDKNTFIDSEYRDVKSESTSVSTTISKSEYQSCQYIVKIENENQPDNIHKNISIEFECENVKTELESSSTAICKSECQSDQLIVKKENEDLINYASKKSLIILIKKGFNYDDNCQLNEKCHLKIVESNPTSVTFVTNHLDKKVLSKFI
ncbi:uncharacterized protein LOC106656384 [Trichogramma pretiosum]|uniref:uncharacterized protein LOC106656384 n=1 Tax=Trichogramma pretiosum TaxID=7493 RepID=UPI0006C95EAD|nr:uncharacterized protein LOC106656384 [Trichogramma pretiosum]